MLRKTGVVVVVALAIPASGCERTRAHLNRNDATSFVEGCGHDGIRKPSDPLGVICNLNIAFQTGWLLDRRLYSDREIQTLSGGNKVHWAERTARSQHAHVTGFQGWLPPLHVGRFTFEGISFDMARWITASGHRKASALFAVSQSDDLLIYDRIERVLGTDWTDVIYFPPPDSHPGPPTNLYGNRRIRYGLHAPGLIGSIVVQFHPDGTLSWMKFTEEEKQ